MSTSLLIFALQLGHFTHKHRYYCMSRYSKIFTKVFASLVFIALISFNNTCFAQDGEALFKANCANCHKPLEDFTGPALQGARKREPSADWAYKWVDNVNTMVTTDPYAIALHSKFGSIMTQQNLKKEEIKAILDWADNYKPAAAGPKDASGGSTGGGEDNSLLYGVLTIILAVIALILLQINSSLRKLT